MTRPPVFEDIAQYLANSRDFDEHRFNRIKAFVRDEGGYDNVQAVLGEYANYWELLQLRILV